MGFVGGEHRVRRGGGMRYSGVGRGVDHVRCTRVAGWDSRGSGLLAGGDRWWTKKLRNRRSLRYLSASGCSRKQRPRKHARWVLRGVMTLYIAGGA